MEYKAIIGLEMHCEISNTNSKVFSSSKNSYSDTPNSNVRPIDMGFPGTLPVVNKEAVKKALMASIMLNCKQPEYMYFERKNYYYPDLPKGYQITQETKPCPVGINGELKYDLNGEFKIAKINNIHLEEDSASTDHYSKFSCIDYNRSGVPLLELVTDPCFRSADEAVAFLETVRSMYRYANISEADSKKGQIRCDVNVSIMEKDKEEIIENFGVKVETKNVNSFSGVREVINYEIKRQTELALQGKKDEIVQETRRYVEDEGVTKRMRTKADAIDYKFFVEPNIPKIKITEEFINEAKESIPVLANERKLKYINEYGLTNYDATILVKDKEISDYYENTLINGTNPKEASNWITSIILGYLNKNNLFVKDLFITPIMLSNLINLVSKKEISSKQAKEVLNEALEKSMDPISIVKEKGIKQIENVEEIINIINEVLDENISAIETYKSGRDNIIDYLVGQVMKKTRGTANPSIARSKMIEEIEKR